MTPFARALIALTVAAAPLPAMAATAVTGFTGGTVNNTTGFDLPFTVGYTFTALQNLTVTALGVYDYQANGLTNAHQVGIWSATGTLLGSATVGSGTGATLLDSFRYVTIGNLSLTSGSQYTIGANFLNGNNADAYIFEPTTVTTSSAIAFGQGVRSGDNSGFARPTQGANTGRFGANFQFTAGAVPEPASWAMMIVGFGAAGASLRLRRTARKTITA